jgi:hypothetical protein
MVMKKNENLKDPVCGMDVTKRWRLKLPMRASASLSFSPARIPDQKSSSNPNRIAVGGW